eukprot:Anaeramoba_ignava/a3011_67.p1 GENE.a3011_67~~a3011_67.p1  ORF type:complete len:304 (-),score=97.74 a3011_67:38-949(-)
MSFFGSKPVCEVYVAFTDERVRKKITQTIKEQKHQLLVFTSGDSVGGKIKIQVKEGKKLEFEQIKVEFIGQIALSGSDNYEFTTLTRELESKGSLSKSKVWDFEFPNVEKQYESYYGKIATLRYFVRLIIERGFRSNIKKEVDIFVMNKQSMPDQGKPITMEVGIQDCIHIQFEYRKSKFHLEDVVIGKVFYLLSRIKLKFMEVSVIRREIIGKGEEIDYHNEIVSRFEIMDGTPVKGESIPIRFFLESLDLTPTYKKINNKFSVRYYLKLTLFDEEDKKYFKQSEIFLYRTHFDPFLKSNQN